MTPDTAVAPLGSTASTWIPVLEGPLADRARQALDAIATGLPSRYSYAGLASGEAGAALFYAYLDRAQADRGWLARSQTHAAQAAQLLEQEVSGPTLYSGFAGVGWAMDHLHALARPEDPEDVNEEIDAILLDLMSRSPWKGQYDLITGLVGYGLYALDRAHRPSGRQLLSLILDRLDESKTLLEDGLSWHTGPELLPTWQRELNPQGYLNLGLAHGVPAVIALLGQTCARGIQPDRSRTLLEGAVSWLLAQRNPAGSASCFVTSIPTGLPREPIPSRIAWCYGDLGLAVALLWAARSTGQRAWEDAALDIARCAARRTLADAGVRDAGLCHGAAGNAHLFNRLWQATRDPLFLDTARAWYEAALAYWTPEAGLEGFRPWVPPSTDGAPGSERGSEDAHSLLEGALGVGLSLLSGLYPIVPEWDRMLMVSVPPIGDKI